MKVILYMAMTVNGYIATPDGDSSFTSQVDEQSFFAMAKEAGNVVMGRNTYDALVAAKAFPIPGALNVIMTSQPPETEPLKNVLFWTASPEEIVEELRSRDMNNVLVAGGGQLAGSFMADGLVDELYLTIEPLAIGQGIHLFEHAEFRRDLELLEVKNISEHEVQLHYAARKYTLDSVIGNDEDS